ncbi:hypothetical protein M0638_02160 [Roseomonas sp. NAR14]|uniref:Flagellar protein FlgN n=1 Tax=Roseomonas acroporae TaxID=2937791 RepID=A0A9X1Y6W7_9PROT|nr:hypothetical protein [Roseomonas acroporae]MCK8783182.1 hypothetical protein [Roseomonas acroporae]
MLPALTAAAQRLAEALDAENAALASLDLTRAAALATAKIQASDAFAAACTTAQKLGQRPEGEDHVAVSQLAQRLRQLGSENRRLLERAIGLQARVIETIAGVALPQAAAPGYGLDGGRRPAPQPVALAVSARA